MVGSGIYGLIFVFGLAGVSSEKGWNQPNSGLSSASCSAFEIKMRIFVYLGIQWSELVCLAMEDLH